MRNRVSYLIQIHQIFLSKKYDIQIYEIIDFPIIQSFPASSKVPATSSKNTKDFKIYKGKNFWFAFQ